MSLKFKVSKDDYEALEEGQQALYESAGSGYQLKVDGLPEPEDTSGLKAKVDQLLGESKAAKQKAKEVEERAQQEADERARKNNDYESLLRSMEEKCQSLTEELKSKNLAEAREKTENAAMKMAAELADGTNAELLAEFIKHRIRFEDGDIQVLDAKGGPTVSTVDELKKEFQTSGRYDSLLRGNKAGGGGAAPSNGGGAAKKLSEMTEAERTSLYREDPDKFRQLKKDEGL